MDELKKTPLYEAHIALGGKMVDFGGWALPVQYSSIIEEHKAVRTACGLFDVSHMGEVFVVGNSAFDYIQNLVTNDITTMTPGRCRYAVMCYEDGGAVDDVLIYKFADDRYMLVVNAANTAKDIEWMKKNVIGDVQIIDESPLWAQLALQGPRFEEILKAAGYYGEIPAKNYTFTDNNIVAGVRCLVSRTGYTGEDGVELYCAAGNAMKLHAALLEAGREFGLLPCALGARDTLRFEASMPLYGHEMSDKINPVECGVDFAIKFKKPAFIGREALMKEKTRQRIGLKVLKGLAREHMPVLMNGEEVGFTTSGGPAPSLGGNYAMAIVPANVPDDAVWTIDVRGRQIPCERVELPFYKRA